MLQHPEATVTIRYVNTYRSINTLIALFSQIILCIILFDYLPQATTDVSFSPTTSPPVQNGRPEIGNNRNYSPRRNSGMLMQHVNGEAAIAILEDDYSAPQKPPRRSR